VRISVTDLDSYLYWLSSEDMTLDQLVARLRGQEPPGPNMLAGRAFHSLLETAGLGEIGSAERDGWTFKFELDAELPIPVVRELKAERVLNIGGQRVTLVGKVDALQGTLVRDYKLTERFDAERYADSYQWRAYLSMFHATAFVYDVFQCVYDDDQVVRITDYHQLRFSAYPEMLADVTRAVSGLVEIIAKHVPEKAAA
jgi:hypothetical protein